MRVNMRVITALLIVNCITVVAQERPQKSCTFDGFSADPKLAEVSTGDLMVPYYAEGAWTCGYIQHRDGAGPQWVKSSDIREVKADPAPPLSAWAGKWVNGDGRIVIEISKSGRLHLQGTAEWHGSQSNHTGNFEDETAPSGNHLHVDVDPCTVDLTLIGNHLVANDNNQCGGMNVRFWGIWKRAL
jgi:hypothetical protein